MDKLYKVEVSSLEIRKEPKTKSKIYISRNSIISSLEEIKQYKFEKWLKIKTLTEPIIEGYVQSKYISKI